MSFLPPDSPTATRPPRATGLTPARRSALTAALVAVGVLAVSAFFTPSTLPKFDICMFHRTTGLPCPGCGLTRAICAISHGQFAAAWQFNPFAYLFYVGTLATPVWAIWKWRNPNRRMFTTERGQKNLWAALLVICLAMIAHDIWRICNGWQ